MSVKYKTNVYLPFDGVPQEVRNVVPLKLQVVPLALHRFSCPGHFPEQLFSALEHPFLY